MGRRGIRTTSWSLLALAALALLVAVPAAASAAPPLPAPSYHQYIGDLHAHTAVSDGRGTPQEAYDAARAGGADFLAVTDHSSSISAAEWTAERAAADAATLDGTFVAIPAFELTYGWGHINAFDVPDLPAKKTGNQGGRKNVVAATYDWLASYPGASAQWNHPTEYSKNFDDFAYYSGARDGVMNLLEVHNYGSWDYYGTTDFESSYVMALDHDWHVMPSANSDTHITDWITGYESRTVLLAPALTRADLYEAMRAHRGYATEDKDLVVEFTVDGQVMGSVLPPPAGDRHGGRPCAGRRSRGHGHPSRDRVGRRARRRHPAGRVGLGRLERQPRRLDSALLLPTRLHVTERDRHGRRHRLDGAGVD